MSLQRGVTEVSLFCGKPVSLLGTGFYVPERILTNFDLEKMVDTSDKWIVERTGIRTRHLAAEEQTTTDLAYQASLRALEKAGVLAEDIDMILVSTNSPDMLFPGVSAKLQGALGASHAGACDIQAGCTSPVYAMALAVGGIASGLWQNVLVVGAESLSRLVDWEDRNTCVLFGDGAGALVLAASLDGKSRFISADLRADGTKSDLLAFPGGMAQYPASHETVEAKMHYVKMKGNEIFKFVNREIPAFLRGFCEKSGVDPSDIDCWIFHQANLRIIEDIAKRLKVDMGKVFVDVDKYGNTSSASVLIALDEALTSGKIQKGQKVLMSSFGAGMTYGAILFEV